MNFFKFQFFLSTDLCKNVLFILFLEEQDESEEPSLGQIEELSEEDEEEISQSLISDEEYGINFIFISELLKYVGPLDKSGENQHGPTNGVSL